MFKFWNRFKKSSKNSSQSEEWTEEQFVESLDLVMKEQESKNPEIKEVHEKLSPEYQQIKQLVAQMLMMEPETRDPLLQKIKSCKEKAVLPLLDTLLALDAMARAARAARTASSEEQGEM